MSFNKVAICTLGFISNLIFPLNTIATENNIATENLEYKKSISLNQIKKNDPYLDTVENTDLKNNLEFEIIGSRIVAKFSYKDRVGQSVELDKLAAKLGYKSFNWVSYVEQDPHGITNINGDVVSVPYNDPPFGGYQYEAADSLPFYWDMTSCDRCNPNHQYNNPRFTKKFELIFEDAPADYRLKPGETIEFITHLVGVKSYDLQANRANWDIIESFRWQLTNDDAGRGSVSLVESNLNPARLSPFVLIEMEADGANLPLAVSRGSNTQEVFSKN